ncbi:MtrB/PioB family decaheme-associated outer membrane protein [Ferrimonas lipolytica]|uniref:MtrB/PioB family decaheme-associated outer membrane protein n=1 Tax=Ferrimonas lipolytica TaxID=2724191 RepID=A0A6H1UES0_9GAMM|nr:MtrB/PioB family decaheme-associated outer membrane protein [Ferrimonas lipolytica]QIZ76292.1 MtrB/PioB family decaheme-associated outer membrane protein [Ferrimonas lipolytica]
MKTKLTLVAASLLALSGPALAFDFGVNAAKTDTINNAKWQCKKCSTDAGAQGSVGLAVGSVDSSDDHAANAFGDDDGFAGAVNADYSATTDGGVRHRLIADELGSKRGDASIKVSQPGAWAVEASYDKKYKVNATDVQSDLTVAGGTLVRQDNLVEQDLEIEREKLGFNAKYLIGQFGTFVELSQESREGNKASSITSGAYSYAQNMVAAIDSDTVNVRAGVNATGKTWFTELGYQASWFENNAKALSFADAQFPSQAGAVDNTAYTIYASGFYNLGRTQIAGRYAMGEMEQDSGLVSLTGMPAGTNSVDVKVDTTDANLRINSRVARRLNLNASFDYSDRDNDSQWYDIEQFSFDDVSGEVKSTTAVDITRATYKFGGNYRIATGHKVKAGVEYENIERSEGQREETDETKLWASYNLSAFELWDLRLKGVYSERDGSDFESNAATSSEQNELMRKYNLADRNRSEVVLEVSHNPLQNLAIDLRSFYALDDYESVEVGLVESKNYGYDLSVSYQPTATVVVDVYGGYQWINNDQLGSTNNSYAEWSAQSEDEFGFAGVEMNYSGLADWGILLGAQYDYARSLSNSYSSSADYLGDYESTTHSAKLTASYALTEAATVGLLYQYERYEDSDYADIAIENYPGDGVYGLTTLGYLSQNYNAHMIMATFSYAL